MEVKELMNPSVVTIETYRLRGSGRRLISRHNVGPCRFAGRTGGCRGMVTDRDIVLRCVAAGGGPGPDTGAGHYDPGLHGSLPRMTAGRRPG